ncbi:MAG: hypothetical protein KDA41_06830 [Planctomycetales bacterium]|nr:hypothetical protein [Planctomycetales bacterium]
MGEIDLVRRILQPRVGFANLIGQRGVGQRVAVCLLDRSRIAAFGQPRHGDEISFQGGGFVDPKQFVAGLVVDGQRSIGVDDPVEQCVFVAG